MKSKFVILDFKSNLSEITTVSSDYVTTENFDKDMCFSKEN